jgi:hypothetical protein
MIRTRRNLNQHSRIDRFQIQSLAVTPNHLNQLFRQKKSPVSKHKNFKRSVHGANTFIVFIGAQLLVEDVTLLVEKVVLLVEAS